MKPGPAAAPEGAAAAAAAFDRLDPAGKRAQRQAENLARTAATAREYLAAYDAGVPMPVTGQSDDMAWAAALASCLRLMLAEVPGA